MKPVSCILPAEIRGIYLVLIPEKSIMSCSRVENTLYKLLYRINSLTTWGEHSLACYFGISYRSTPFLQKIEARPAQLMSIFLTNVLAKTVSHRNLQKMPRYLALISWGSLCKFLSETILVSTFLRKMDFRHKHLD